MAESTKQDIQKSTPKISWKDVITINPKGFSNEDLIKLYQSLDEIENTKSGQTLFNGVMLRNKELGLPDGKVEIAFAREAGYNTKRNIILVNPESYEHQKTVFFTNDGKPFEGNLSTSLFHEIAHHADTKSVSITKKLIDLQEAFNEIDNGIYFNISADKKIFSINQETPFFASLTSNEQKALIELENAAENDDISPNQFAILFAAKKVFLLQNANIKQNYEYINEEKKLLYDFELRAVKVTNEFKREIGMPERSGYNSSITLELGSVENPQTEPDQQDIDYAKWEAQTTWNEVKSDGKLTLQDLRANPPPVETPLPKFFIPPELQQQLSSLGGFPVENNPSVQLAVVPKDQTSKDLQR